MFDSKKDEKLEQISSIFDGEDCQSLKLNQDCFLQNKNHLQNWSLIGSTLRNELPEKIDLSFVDKVVSQIDALPVNDEVEVHTHDKVGFKIVPYFKKAGIYISQLAIAATVACVTVIGYQTYNASDPSVIEPAASSAVGNISGVNLASYQNTGNDNVIKLKDMKKEHTNLQNMQYQNEAEIKDQQEKEIQRINDYLQGYYFDTAAY